MLPGWRDWDLHRRLYNAPLGIAVTAELEDCLSFESDPAHVRLARTFVARTLRQWELGNFVADAQLVLNQAHDPAPGR